MMFKRCCSYLIKSSIVSHIRHFTSHDTVSIFIQFKFTKSTSLFLNNIKISKPSQQGLQPTAHALLLHHTARRYVQAYISGEESSDLRDLTEAIAALIVAKTHHLYTAGEVNLITLIFTQTDEGTHTLNTIQQIATCLNQICGEMPRKTEVSVPNIGEDASVVKLNVMTIQQALDEARHDLKYFEQPKNQLKRLILGTEIDVPTGPVHQVFSYTINDVCEGRVPNADPCPNKGPVVADQDSAVANVDRSHVPTL
jgi:hypothetical protein